MNQYSSRQKFRLRLRFLFFVLTLLAISGVWYLLFWQSGTFALTRSPQDIFDNPDRLVLVVCKAIVKVSLIETVGFNGLPIIGNTVELDASRVKIFAQIPTLTSSLFSSSCDKFYAGLSEGGFEWELLSRPPGSVTSIKNPESLTPTLKLDQPGEYEIKFTACADGSCQLLLNNREWTATPASKTFTIEALSKVVIPPETEPMVPSLPHTPMTAFPDYGDLCGFLPASPAWHTVEPWNGPGDYELVEGLVRRSRSSTTDNNLNHDTLDFIFYVEPDPPFHRLLATGELEWQNWLEVEWERHNFHPMARPTRGDRASAMGYWIHDCGHGAKTEIHPPVMVASHRARPIVLPESEGYGSNIYIPGIVSTVYVNRDAGEGTRTCGTTGLHETREVKVVEPDGRIYYNCLPNAKGYSGNPIDRVYTYNIYLPRNPRAIYADIGRTVPAADLFCKFYYPFGSAGPDPRITERTSEEGLTYLEVRIDLRGYTGRTYGRRIEAGWIYPSPDNWGIRRWRLQVNSVQVHDDMDPDIDLLIFEIENPGDWRLWLNTNNTAQEWTMIFDEDCNDCVEEGLEDFGGLPWATGDATSSHSLGPDILLFPFSHQPIWVHSSGYENEYCEDRLGEVNRLLPQKEGTYSHRCNTDVYTLNYQILAGPAVGPPNLKFKGRQTYERYVIKPDPRQLRVPIVEVAARDWNHPDDMTLPPGSPPFNLADSGFFRAKEPERLSLEGLPTDEFRQRIAAAQRERAADLDASMKELREEMDILLQRPQDPDVFKTLTLIKDAMPADLWEQHFGDIDLDKLRPHAPILVPLWLFILAIVLTAVILVLLFLFISTARKRRNS